MFGWSSAATARFHFETLPPRGIAGHFGWKNLQRDVAIQARVASAVDLAHSPGAQQGEDLVRAESGPGGEWHRISLILLHWRIAVTLDRRRLNHLGRGFKGPNAEPTKWTVS